VEKEKARDEAEEAASKRQEQVGEAQTALQAARKSVEDAGGERLALEKDRDEFVADIETLWTPLKNSEIASKDWRARDKLITRLGQQLKRVGVAESLLKAVPVALKTKAGERSEFANTTVAHAEELYGKHIEALKGRVESFGAEEARRAEAVTAAEGAAKVAEDALAAATESSSAAQAAFKEETKAEREHAAKMKKFPARATKLEKQLAKAQAELQHLNEVVTSFEALRNAPAAPAAPAAEAAAAEVVLPEN